MLGGMIAISSDIRVLASHPVRQIGPTVYVSEHLVDSGHPLVPKVEAIWSNPARVFDSGGNEGNVLVTLNPFQVAAQVAEGEQVEGPM